MAKSQYTDNITGDVVVNMRSIDGNLYNLIELPKRIKSISRPWNATPDYVNLKNTTTKFSTQSLYFKGRAPTTYNSLRLNLNFTTEFNMNKFTIGCWVYRDRALIPADNNGRNFPNTADWDRFRIYFNNLYLMIDVSVTHNIVTYVNGSSYIDLSGTPDNLINTWNYYTWCKNGNTLYRFVNGTLQQTFNIPVSIPANYSGLELTSWAIINCYIDDLVFVHDQCLWTSNFTVPNYYLLGDYEKKISKFQKIYPTFHNRPVYDDRIYLY